MILLTAMTNKTEQNTMKPPRQLPSEMPLPDKADKYIAAFAIACGMLGTVLTIYQIIKK